ncbi:hypothetical protein M0R45_005218 [Rubus argutus]|uniref:Uncharacterized protein n=1 Tax=Rubus argutus TaxID=59490 RepID=A0AAW1YM03_RUBAR
MEADSNGVPFDGVLFGRECRSSDEFSISYSRKFPKSTGKNLQRSLQMVKSTLALYGFSCELNLALKVFSGSFSDIILTGNPGLCSRFSIEPILAFSNLYYYASADTIGRGDPNSQTISTVFPTLGEVRNVIDLPVNEQEGIVICGFISRSKDSRQIVQDCIVHNMHPERWVTTSRGF